MERKNQRARISPADGIMGDEMPECQEAGLKRIVATSFHCANLSHFAKSGALVQPSAPAKFRYRTSGNIPKYAGGANLQKATLKYISTQKVEERNPYDWYGNNDSGLIKLAEKKIVTNLSL